MRMVESQKKPWLSLVAGRSLDEQIEYVRKNRNHDTLPMLRRMVLQGVGIPPPKERAKNVIVFGCYLSFLTPLLLRDYIEILDRLGIEYTYLQDEFCCGLPMIQTTEGAEREKAIEVAKELMRTNRDLAQHKGAETMTYCCVWCAHLAKQFYPDEANRHLYYPDSIINRLERETLRVAPTTIGYYEGCHKGNRYYAPDVSLDWGRYRQLLDRIEGLRVVDLPHRTCCRDYPERIVEAAEKNNLDTILCSCISGYVTVGAVAKGRVQVKYFPEVLLQSLRGG